MKGTFRTKQPLESLEFGSLFYNTLPKGVYVAPKVTVIPLVNNEIQIQVQGGSFIFYNKSESDEDKEIYAIKIDLEEDVLTIEDANLTKSGSYYIFANYKWSNSSNIYTNLSLSFVSAYSIEGIEDLTNGVRICRIVNGKVDTSVMEMAGTGYTCPKSIVKWIQYSRNANDNAVWIKVNSKFLIDSGLTEPKINPHTGYSNPAKFEYTTYGEAKPLLPDDGYYIFIDNEGILQMASSNVPRLGKFVIAEKKASTSSQSATDFEVCNTNVRSEFTAANIQVPFDETMADSQVRTLYESSMENGQVILSKLLANTLASLQGVSSQGTSLSSRIQTLETVLNTILNALAIDGQGNVIVKKNLTVTENTILQKAVALNGAVSVNNSISFGSNSMFGTPTSPINTMYVKNSLYTENLVLEE